MVGRIGTFARVLLLVVAGIVACTGSSKRSQREAGESTGGRSNGASAGEGGTEPGAGRNSGGVAGVTTGGVAGDDARGGSSGTAGSGAGGAVGSSGSGTIDPSGGVAGGAGEAGAGGDGTTEPECTNGECWDGMRCETTLDALGCPAMYPASPPDFPPEQGADCSGSTGDGYFTVRQEVDHSLLCVYGAFSPLVYSARSDAEPVHCNQRSRDVVAGQAPNDLRVVHYHSYRGCVGVAESSRSTLFNELFPEIPSQEPCTPAEDECRGRVSLLVCEDSQCEPCTSDTQCAAEYPYAGDEVSCRGGVCYIGSIVGSCATDAPTTACNTASGAYACVDRHCARCTTHDDCVTTTGDPRSTCGADGTCSALP